MTELEAIRQVRGDSTFLNTHRAKLVQAANATGDDLEMQKYADRLHDAVCWVDRHRDWAGEFEWLTLERIIEDALEI